MAAAEAATVEREHSVAAEDMKNSAAAAGAKSSVVAANVKNMAAVSARNPGATSTRNSAAAASMKNTRTTTPSTGLILIPVLIRDPLLDLTLAPGLILIPAPIPALARTQVPARIPIRIRGPVLTPIPILGPARTRVPALVRIQAPARTLAPGRIPTGTTGTGRIVGARAIVFPPLGVPVSLPVQRLPHRGTGATGLTATLTARVRW
jgi:hypothetical protein